MNQLQFEYCPTCGNIIEKIEDHHVPLMCCGKKLEPLIPNSTDAAVEKHLPLATLTSDSLIVRVGEVEHPMIDAHLISWVIIQTPTTMIRRTLQAGETPRIMVPRPEAGTPIRVYAYCNLHGLWGTEIMS